MVILIDVAMSGDVWSAFGDGNAISHLKVVSLLGCYIHHLPTSTQNDINDKVMVPSQIVRRLI